MGPSFCLLPWFALTVALRSILRALRNVRKTARPASMPATTFATRMQGTRLKAACVHQHSARWIRVQPVYMLDAKPSLAAADVDETRRNSDHRLRDHARLPTVGAQCGSAKPHTGRSTCPRRASTSRLIARDSSTYGRLSPRWRARPTRCTHRHGIHATWHVPTKLEAAVFRPGSRMGMR